MERGENRFKDEQLEIMASLYGDEPTSYKDMQDVDAIIKAAGYFNDKDRAFRLMKMAFSYMFPVFDDMGKPTDLTVFIPKDFIEVKPIPKEDQRKIWMEIIKRMMSRSRSNYNTMNEIGDELTKMIGFPEKNKYLFVRNFIFSKTSKFLLTILSGNSKIGSILKNLPPDFTSY